MSFVGGLRAAILLVAPIGAIGGAEFAPRGSTRMMPFAAADKDAKTPVVRDKEEAAKTRRRTVVWSALSLIAGIALLGVFLIVVIVLWGIRHRQRNRTRKAREAAFDPLWYLRTGDKNHPPTTPDEKPRPDEPP